MSRNRLGFTLIEILVVVAIVAIVAAVLFPVLASAKKATKRAVSISNLRQCGLALQLYAPEEPSMRELPDRVGAAATLKFAPTCDPNDYWRPSCSQEFGAPLVGSYAYVRGVGAFAPDAAYKTWLHYGTNLPVLVSIFYSAHRIPVFHGEGPTDDDCGADIQGCAMPDRVVVLRQDGSAHFDRVQLDPGQPRLITWSSLFFRLGIRD